MKTITAVAGVISILAGAATYGAPARAWGTWIVETHEHAEETYTVMQFGYIAGGRDLRVVVRGNPTRVTQQAFEAAVTAIMNANQPGYQARTHFTSKPNSSARKSYKVVLVLGDMGVSENAACRDPDKVPTVYSGGNVRLTAVLCRRDERINSVRSRVSRIATTDDTALEDMISSAMRRIFPSQFRLSKP